MATRQLYMDLSLASSWISADNQDSTISGAFEQKQENLPKVVWSMNTVPFTAGAKSLTPSQYDDVPDLAITSIFGPLYDLGVVVDFVGDITYMSNNDTLSAGTSRQIDIYNSTSVTWKRLSSSNIDMKRFHKRQTLFQTQTLFAHTAGEAIDGAVTINGALTGNDVFSYKISDNSINVSTLNGIVISDKSKFGMTSHQNYLIFWDKDRIYWSNPIDFTDFTPSIGGGGNTQIAEAAGEIITIVPNLTGLVIYCRGNIVHAAFSGDASNPWIFTAIAGSSGLVSSGQRHLVTSNESLTIQVAVLAEGLVQITENEVTPLSPAVLEAFNDTQIEKKAVGIVDFTRKGLPFDPINTLEFSTEISQLKIIGSDLFIFTGDTTFYASNMAEHFADNRLNIFNLRTNRLVIVEGMYASATREINLNTGSKAEQLPSKYLTNKRHTLSNGSTFVSLNLADNTNRVDGGFSEADAEFRDAEFLVGNISISRERTTIIHSIKLDGRLEEDGGVGTNLAKVFAYSKEVLGASNPIEFIYNPADGTHYGHIEAKDVLVEVRGKNFYLTGMEIEVESGGVF